MTASARSIEDIKPIIQPGALGLRRRSTTCSSCWCAAVATLPMVKTMLIPEAVGAESPTMPAKHRAMYNYCNGVMEPWDGPAAIAAVAGKWALVGLDRNGLRPMRYVRHLATGC